MTALDAKPEFALLAAAGLGALIAAGCSTSPQTSETGGPPAAAEIRTGAETFPGRSEPITGAPLSAVRFGLVSRTTALVGMTVKNRHEARLGELEDLILDLPSGQVLVAVISTGAKGQVTPVPARTFWTASSSKLLLNADRKQLKSAPRFAKADLAQIHDIAALSGTFHHFNQDLPGTSGAGSIGFWRATQVVHLPLVSRTNEPLGRIEDVMVDLPMGRIVYLLIAPGVGPDPLNVRYVVPPQAAHPDAAGQAMVLNADEAQFVAGPHFQKAYWTEMNLPEMASAMMQHYGLETPPSGGSDPTRQPARANLASAAGPSQNAAALSDVEITKAVVTEIVRVYGMLPTRELKIVTTAGRVTLSGRLGSNKQKSQLAAVAARVVGEANVVNLLETR